MEGKLIIFSAPSGSGKTTIVKQLLETGLNLEFSISATSRSPRNGEVDGKDYYFLSADEFKQRIANDEFVEWEEVYENCFYGTLRSELTRIWDNGNHVLFDVDVKGGVNLKQKFDDKALAIFVKVASIEILKERLTIRGTETAESMQKRLNKAEFEITFADKFDIVIENNVLEEAVDKTYKALTEFLNR